MTDDKVNLSLPDEKFVNLTYRCRVCLKEWLDDRISDLSKSKEKHVEIFTCDGCKWEKDGA